MVGLPNNKDDLEPGEVLQRMLKFPPKESKELKAGKPTRQKFSKKESSAKKAR